MEKLFNDSFENWIFDLDNTIYDIKAGLFVKISERIYRELDNRLANSKFLAGKNYTIADIATFPWIARHDWHDIGLKKYINLSRWYEEISDREAVKKGFDLLKRGETIPKP